jgi:aspartate/methionine/tyrosine aminotransferase
VARVPPHGEVNAITRAVERLRATRSVFIDLSESNPTQVDLPYPPDLLQALADPRARYYEPQPLGLRSAREAVAGEFARRGRVVDPDHLVLSASTSEAYSWLFKLLCDPGDVILVPQPSYPLFDYLSRLEAVRTVPYPVVYHGRWEVDAHTLADAPETTRAVLAVSPNNPTGSFLSSRDLAALVDHCRRRNWALIVDEVFADYAVETGTPLTDIAAQVDVLAFTLGGASKAIGLPQVKLGWTLVGGPAARRNEALSALEVIADTYLSVSTPVQVAAPRLLRDGAAVRAAIQERVVANLATARRLAISNPACDLLPVEGGWSLIVRVPAARSEEQMVLDLLEQERVLVHPGFFFDLPHEAFFVVSLLAAPAAFADGFARMLRHVHS